MKNLDSCEFVYQGFKNHYLYRSESRRLASKHAPIATIQALGYTKQILNLRLLLLRKIRHPQEFKRILPCVILNVDFYPVSLQVLKYSDELNVLNAGPHSSQAFLLLRLVVCKAVSPVLFWAFGSTPCWSRTLI
jgi:hypothetical protein